MAKPVFLPLLISYVQTILKEISQIDLVRKMTLNTVIDYMRHADQPRLNFICTHNSRRSHLAQIWAQTAATYFKIDVETFSGGTETTAFHPNAVLALERAGFAIENPGGENPRYAVQFSKDSDPIICFSKKYDDEINPKTDYAAIMTCSEADQECPVVFGASHRVKLLYEDPKIADGTEEEEEKYDERCKQIATEMFYVFSNIK